MKECYSILTAGGFNSYTFGADGEFSPEFVWSYEIGMKADWLDNRLRTSISAFNMDYSDLQQGLLLTNKDTGIQTQSIRNASKAKISGVELELETYLTDNLKITATGTWLDATYDDLITEDELFPELGERDLSGNKIPRTPEKTFTLSGEYTIPLNSQWQSKLAIDYSWQDHMFFTFYNHELASQDSYGILGFHGSIESVDEHWNISAYVNNVLDERYIASSRPINPGAGNALFLNGNIGKPRTYVLNIEYKF